MPKSEVDFLDYFVGDTEFKDTLQDTEPQRVALYKLVTSLVRAYANIADEMEEAGFSEQEARSIQSDVAFYHSMKRAVELASGDYIELKKYEPAMRFLLDSYIGAKESRVLAAFEDVSLVDMLVEKGIDAVKELPENIKKHTEAVAEVIEGNYRKEIVEQETTNPAYYAKMSELLDTLISERKKQTKEYEEYLEELIALAPRIKNPENSTSYPSGIDSPAKRALWDNFNKGYDFVSDVHEAIMGSRKDGWRDHPIKLRAVTKAVGNILEKHGVDDFSEADVVELARNQREY
jgi:type I restriction enzyme R subunit